MNCRLVPLRGSPPHAWGILISVLFEDFLIPVHPHMRGEYGTAWELSKIQLGSPPHAWGILEALPELKGKDRFIPTCVGNTKRLGYDFVYHTVHPHMRGEYALET